MDTIKTLDWEMLLGGRHHRLQGVHLATHILELGRTNWASLAQLTRENAILRQAEGADREELRAIREGIDALENLIAIHPTDKPRLPKLRVESFRSGEAVMLYVGDAEGCIAHTPWISGQIVAVEKAHNPRWNDGGPNGGYYWRLMMTSKTPVFPDSLPIAFSTSEPRALPQADYDYLVWAKQNDPVFFALFCANAHRTWTPLWCEERGVSYRDSPVSDWFV
jgi:hypothetical protein